MLDVIKQDYIRTAKGKGVQSSRVIWVHALRNAAVPVVTIIGLQFGVMLGGPDDRMLLQYIRTAAERIEVELMSVDPELDLASEMTPSGRLTLCGPGTPLERCIEGKQLGVVSYDAWNHLIRYARPLLDALPSFVIVKPRQDAR